MRHRTLLLFAFGFVSGIAIATPLQIRWWLVASTGIAALFLIVRSSKIEPIPLILLGLSLGIFRCSSYIPPGANMAAFVNPAPVTIVGDVVSDPLTDPSKASFLILTREIVTRKGTFLTTGQVAVLVHGAARSTLNNIDLGDRVQLSGALQDLIPATNPGEFDWRARSFARGTTAELVVQRPHGALVTSHGGFTSKIGGWSRSVGLSVEKVFSANLTGTEATLLDGVLFGRRNGLPPDFQQEFVATGTAHILATAGLHVGIVALTLGWALQFIPMPRKWSAAIIIVLLWIFAALAGGRPAVVRAVCAATIYYAGIILERVPDLSTTLAVAALGLLADEPPLLWQSDFQLSFVTVAGLALIMPILEQQIKPHLELIKSRAFRQPVRWIVEIICLSLVAQLCSAPLMAYYFSEFSLMSFPTNILVVPLLFILIPSTLFALLISFVFAPVGTLVFHFVVHPLLQLILHIVGFFYSLPICSISIAPPPAVPVVLLYLTVYGGILYFSNKKLTRTQSHPPVKI